MSCQTNNERSTIYKPSVFYFKSEIYQFPVLSPGGLTGNLVLGFVTSVVTRAFVGYCPYDSNQRTTLKPNLVNSAVNFSSLFPHFDDVNCLFRSYFTPVDCRSTLHRRNTISFILTTHSVIDFLQGRANFKNTLSKVIAAYQVVYSLACDGVIRGTGFPRHPTVTPSGERLIYPVVS